MTRRVTKIMRDQPFGLNEIKEAAGLDSGDELSPKHPAESDTSLVDGTKGPKVGTKMATIQGTPTSRAGLSEDSLRSNSSLRTTPKSSPSGRKETPQASQNLSTQNMNPAPRGQRVERYVDRQAAHRARRVSLREELAD